MASAEVETGISLTTVCSIVCLPADTKGFIPAVRPGVVITNRQPLSPGTCHVVHAKVQPIGDWADTAWCALANI